MYVVYEKDKADKMAAARRANTERIRVLTRFMKATEALDKAKADYAEAEAAYTKLAGIPTAVSQSNVGLPKEF